MERKIKERTNTKKEDKSKKEEVGVIYKLKCRNCDKIYIGETKFKMEKRILQHKKDVEYGRTEISAIARHTEQFKHKIDWTNAEYLETEKRLFPRKPRKCLH